MMFNPNRKQRCGVTAVEFAIIAPILFLIILGTIEIGRGFMVQHLLTNAARQGCRAGVLEGKTNSDVTTAVNASLAQLGISSEVITVAVNDVTANASSSVAGDEITVIVSVPVTSVSWVPTAKFLSGTISGQYTLRRE